MILPIRNPYGIILPTLCHPRMILAGIQEVDKYINDFEPMLVFQKIYLNTFWIKKTFLTNFLVTNIKLFCLTKHFFSDIWATVEMIFLPRQSQLKI